MGKQDITFEIDGQPAGTPANLVEINLSANWGTREGITEKEISTTAIEFVLDDAKKINQHIKEGLTGGVGIFEGLPYKIAINQTNIFDGYIDLTNDAQFIENERVVANVVKKGGADWLNDVADGFSFGFLREENYIKDSDFVVVPYVLNFRPEAFIVGQLSIAFFLLQKELSQAIESVVTGTRNIIKAFTPNIAIIPVPPLGEMISLVIGVVAKITYTLAIVIALIEVVKDLVDQFFPPVRRYRAMTIKRMFQVGCDYLGLTFQSTIFDDPIFGKSVLLPSKSERGGLFGNTDKLGNPNQNSAVYNFGDFIRTMLSMFNANYKIDNKTFVFERRDYWNNLSTYILPDVETNQSARLSELQYNTDEFVKNYFISFQTDTEDQNTLDNFDGTNYQIISEPKSITNKSMIAGKGLAQIRPPFALATMKTSLTFYETKLAQVCQLADRVVNFLQGNSNLSSKITNRIGMMNLTADTTTTDKFMFMNGTQMNPIQVSAKMLWDNFHFIESFAEITDSKTNQIVHNQQIIRTAEKIPFCLKDWNQLLKNNKFKTVNGENGEIISIDWDFQKGIANINYKIKKLYTKNLKLVFNNGQ